jgi:hypothetical protein
LSSVSVVVAVLVVAVLVLPVLRVVAAARLVVVAPVVRSLRVCAGTRPSPASMLATGSATVSRAMRCPARPRPAAKTSPSAMRAAKRMDPH